MRKKMKSQRTEKEIAINSTRDAELGRQHTPIPAAPHRGRHRQLGLPAAGLRLCHGTEGLEEASHVTPCHGVLGSRNPPFPCGTQRRGTVPWDPTLGLVKPRLIKECGC